MKRLRQRINWITICLTLLASIWTNYPVAYSAKAEAALPTPGTPSIGQAGDETSLQVVWSNPTVSDTMNGYVVYRSIDDLNFQVIAETALSETSYTDTGLQSGQRYYYRIASKDANGNTSTPTASVSAAPGAIDLPPATPRGFRGEKQTDTFTVSWVKNTETDLAGYQLYRSEDGVNYGKVHTELLADTQYADNSLVRGKLYFYRISAVDLAGHESPLSNEISTEMDAFASDRNVIKNGDFHSDLSEWRFGSYQLYNDPEYSEALLTLDTGYAGVIKNAGQAYSGQGKAVKIEVSGESKKARTTLYQRKLEIVPTGEPVQFSFAWKKNCQCKKDNNTKQILRVEIARPDSSWVKVWEDTPVGNMSEYALVENIDLTKQFTQAGTYDIRIITELWTAAGDSGAVNQVSFDEVFLDLPRGPQAPKGLTVNVGKEGEALHLSWTPNSETNVEGYQLYRSTEEKGNYVLVNSQPIQGTSYDDNGLNNGQTYYYYLKADGSGVESMPSRPVRGVPTFIDPVNHPHHTYMDSTNACASCHMNHKAKSKSKTLLQEASEAKLCLTCHDGTGSRYNTKGQFTENDKSYHPVTGTILSPAGSMECSICHNPHAANGERKTSPAATGSLANVSGVDLQYESTPFTNPLSFSAKAIIDRESELCLSCHSTNPKAPVETKTTASGKEFHPGNVSGHNSMAESVSSGFGRYVNGWTATSQISCTDCHGSPPSPDNHQGVHGSPNANLLKLDFTDQTKADTDSNALCFECHDRSSYGGNPNKDTSHLTVGETRFKRKTGQTGVGVPAAGENLHNFWNAEKNSGHLGLACAQCHSAVPHGTGKLPALLVDLTDSEPYQRYKTNTNLKIYYPADGDWTNKNSCATPGAGCHMNVP